MATIKISELADVPAILGNTIVPVVSNVAGSLTTVKANVNQIRTFILGTLSTSDLANLSANVTTLFSNAASQAGSLAQLVANAGVQSGQLANLVANAATQNNEILTLGNDLINSNTAMKAYVDLVVTSNVAEILDGSTFTGNISLANITISDITGTTSIFATNTDGNVKLVPNGTGVVDVSSAQISNLSDPTSAQDAVTLSYLTTALSSSVVNLVNDDTELNVIDDGITPGRIENVVDGILISRHNATNVEVLTDIIILGNVIPSNDLAFSLGSNTNQWSELWVSNSSIYIGGAALTIIDGNLQVNGNDITANVSQLLIDTFNLTANAAIQAGLLADLDANAAVQAGLIAALEANAAVQAGEIANLYANAAVQLQEIENLKANTDFSSTAITSLVGNAAIQAALIADLEANAAVQAGLIAAAEGNVVTANTAMKGYVDNQVSTLTANIAALDANAAVQAGLIAALDANAAVQADALASLEANAAAQAGLIAALDANAAVQAGLIAALDANAAVQAGALASLGANAAVQAGLIAALDANAAAQAGAISAIVSYSNALVASYLPVYSGNAAVNTLTVNNVINGNSDGVGNIGETSKKFNTIFAKATSAQYADLAENYQADSQYEPGTVVIFGGEKEITTSTVSHDYRIAGVISTQPAYIMNSALDCGLPVALIGRVPCKVTGKISKGDLLVQSATAGVAEKLQNYVPGCVIGKALENYDSDNVGIIEVTVGRL